jgi:tungstate transport system ATP-binding protein
MLGVRNLTHRYGDRTVLAIPSLDLVPGAVTALVGPNGSGKSTLLRILAGVERPAAGEVMGDGRPLRSAAERRALRRQVTLVEQHPLLFDMTVRENLTYALTLHGSPAGRALQPEEALELLGITALAQRPARGLSGGETQRVALARAILLAPRALLLDEPLSAADRSARAALSGVLEWLAATGTTVCLASHLLEDAYRWSARIWGLVEGRLTDVTPENMFRADLPPGAGSRVVRAGPLTLTIVTERTGPVTIAIPPDDIIVSRAPLASSARNQFAGRVVAISDDGHDHVRVTVDVGTELVARVTPAAVAELGLAVGMQVVLSVKAMAVRVF